MSAADWFCLLLLAAAFAAAVYGAVRRRRRGGCGCGCAGCRRSCHKREQEELKEQKKQR